MLDMMLHEWVIRSQGFKTMYFPHHPGSKCPSTLEDVEDEDSMLPLNAEIL
jgi:hypothetical protein